MKQNVWHTIQTIRIIWPSIEPHNLKSESRHTQFVPRLQLWPIPPVSLQTYPQVNTIGDPPPAPPGQSLRQPFLINQLFRYVVLLQLFLWLFSANLWFNNQYHVSCFKLQIVALIRIEIIKIDCNYPGCQSDSLLACLAWETINFDQIISAPP